MRKTEGFSRECCEGRDIYIWGTATYGELALRGLESMGLRPKGFIDSNKEINEKYGYPVITPEQYLEERNSVVLLSALNSFRHIYRWCVENKVECFYDILPLIELEYDESILTLPAAKEKREKYKYKAVIENIDYSQIVINHCEIVLTERCSLKCKNCANLMQYYEQPEDIDKQNILHAFSNMLKVVDCFTNLKLLGGEPFLYKDIDAILDMCVQSPKILDININTNGTIIPRRDVIEKLKSDKISVSISNYGEASRQKDALYNVLNENGVRVSLGNQQAIWKDLGGLQKREYTDKQIEYIFRSCESAKCNTFYRGAFYRCPRSAHGNRLGAFDNAPYEYVDFNGEIDVEQKRRELIDWIKNDNVITACYYCNGLRPNAPDIIGGEQVSKYIDFGSR